MTFEHLVDRLTDTLKTWADAFAAWLPHLAVALVLTLFFYLVSRVVRRATERALQRTRLHLAARDLVGRGIQLLVLLIGLAAILSVLRLDKAVTSLLAGAGVAGLAVGLAAQELASNVIAGVGLSFRSPFRIGDIIETNGIVGVAERIDLRVTTVRTFDGKKILIPNRKIFHEVLINHTDNDLKRVDVACGVSYGEDLDRVKQVVLDALGAIEGRSADREPEAYFTSYGDSAVELSARLYIEYSAQRDLLVVQDAMVRGIKRAFDANGITIPFPIRTLDFGIKGGKTLAEVLPRSVAGR